MLVKCPNFASAEYKGLSAAYGHNTAIRVMHILDTQNGELVGSEDEGYTIVINRNGDVIELPVNEVVQRVGGTIETRNENFTEDEEVAALNMVSDFINDATSQLNKYDKSGDFNMKEEVIGLVDKKLKRLTPSQISLRNRIVDDLRNNLKSTSIWNKATELAVDKFDFKVIEDEEEVSLDDIQVGLTRSFNTEIEKSTTTSISNQVKYLINSLAAVYKDNNGKINKVINPLTGAIERVSFKENINAIKRIATAAIDKQDLLNIFSNAAKYLPFLEDLVARAEGSEDVKNMLWAAFNTADTNSTFGYSHGKDFTLDESHKQPKYFLSDSWIADIKRNSANGIFTPEFINRLAKRLNAEANELLKIKDVSKLDKLIQLYKEVALELNIDLPSEALYYYSLDAKKHSKQEIYDAQTLMLKHKVGTLLKDIVSGLDTSGKSDITGYVNELAELVVNNSAVDTEIMYNTVEGNKTMLITHPNMLTEFARLIHRDTDEARAKVLKLLTDMLNDPAMRNSNWLVGNSEHPGFLVNNNGVYELNNYFLEDFNFFLTGGIKNGITNVGNTYANLSDTDWHGLINLYYLKKRSSTDRTCMIPTITPSDSTKMIFARVFKFKIGVKDTIRKTINDFKLNRTSTIYNALDNIVKQETARMIQAKEMMFELNEDGSVVIENGLPKLKAGLDTSTLLRNYHTNKKGEIFVDGKVVGGVFKYHHFIGINDMDIFDKFGIIKNTSSKDYDYINYDEVYDIIDKQLLYSIGKYYDYNKGFASMLISKGVHKNEVGTVIAEIYLNRLIHNVELQNFFYGTPAEFPTVEESNKRANAVIKHGRSPFDSGSSNYIIIKDSNLKSLVYDKLKTIVEGRLNDLGYQKDTDEYNRIIKDILDNYESINIADAQGYYSLDFEVQLLKAMGQFQAVEHLFNTIDDKHYTLKDDISLELLSTIAANKPFVATRQLEVKYVGGEPYYMMQSNQIKTSTIALSEMLDIPELKKLHAWMQANNVQEVYFESAQKQGIESPDTLVDDKGNLIEANLSKLTILNRPLSATRIQQEVPEHFRDSKNKLGLQIKRHIISNISDDALYELYPNMTGGAIKQHYFDLISANIREDWQRLIKDLGAYFKDGELTFDSHIKLQQFLYKEAKRRGFSKNDIKAIGLDNITHTFYMPITFNHFIYKWQSVLSSLVTNNVIGQKMPGGHIVAMSNVFGSKLKYVGVTDAKTAIANITAAKPITEDNTEVFELDRLKPIVEEGDKLIVECYLPAWSKQFINDDGTVIDINKIPTELRTMIAYRIPTSGKHSAVVLKVVGFLPTTYNTIVVADDVVARLGMDFDVDSLFTITKTFRKTKNGKFKIFKFNNDSNSRLIAYARKQDKRINEIYKEYQDKINDVINSEEEKEDIYNEIIEATTRINEYREQLANPNLTEDERYDIESEIEIDEDYVNDNYSYANDELNIGKQIKKLVAQRDTEIQYVADSFKEDFDKLNRYEQESRAARDNEIFDVMHFILQHDAHKLETIRPATFSESESIANKYNSKKTFKLIASDPITQDVFRQRALTGKQALEIAASSTAALTIFQHTKAQLIEGVKVKHTITNFLTVAKAKEMYGEDNVVEYTDGTMLITHKNLGWNEDGSFHSIQGKASLITDVSGQLVDHAADAVKKPVLFNLNKATINVYTMLTSLGCSIEEAAALISQPIILDYYREYLKSNSELVEDKFGTPYYNTSKNYKVKIYKLINKINKELTYEKVLGRKVDAAFLKEVDRNEYLHLALEKLGIDHATTTDADDVVRFSYMAEYFTINQLDTMIDYELQKHTDEQLIKYYIRQLNTLETFNTYNNEAKVVTKYTMILNADKVGISPKLEKGYNFLSKIYQVNEEPGMISKRNDKELAAAIYPSMFEEEGDSVYSLLESYVKYGYVEPLQLLSQLFITDVAGTRIITSDVRELFQYFDNVKQERIIGKFHNYLMKQLLLHDEFFQIDTNEADRILGKVKSPNEESFASKLIALRKSIKVRKPQHEWSGVNTPEYRDLKITDTHILNYLKPKITPEVVAKTGYEVIEVADTNNLSHIDDKLTQDILDMYNSPDADQRDFVFDLIRYSYLTKGLLFGYNSYAKFIPVEIYKDLGIDILMMNTLELLKDPNNAYVIFKDDITQDFVIENFNDNDIVPILPRPRKFKFTTYNKKGEITHTYYKDGIGAYVVPKTDLKGWSLEAKHGLLVKQYKVAREGGKDVFIPTFYIRDFKYEAVLENNKAEDAGKLIFRELNINTKEIVYKDAVDTSDVKEDKKSVRGKSKLTFKESSSSGYPARTRENASADATIAIAANFNSGGEILTKKAAGEKWIGINFDTLSINNSKVHENNVTNIVVHLNTLNATSLNIAGNSISSLSKRNYTQKQIDDYTYKLLKDIIEHPLLKNTITLIRSGGQTGFDEAGIKAGIKLGIPTLALAPKGWMFRDINGIDVSNEKLFKERFNPTDTQLNLFEERYSVAQPISKEELESQATNLKKIFSEHGIEVTIVNDENLSSNAKIEYTAANKATITINPNKVKGTSVFHEFGHLYIDLVRDKEFINTGIEQLRDTKLWNDITALYPELNETDLGREVLTTAIGIEANNLFNNPEQLRKWNFWLNRLFRRISDIIYKITNGRLGSEIDIAKKLAADLVNNNLSKRIGGALELKTQHEKDKTTLTFIDNSVEYLERMYNNNVIQIRQFERSVKAKTSKYVENLKKTRDEIDLPTLIEQKNISDIYRSFLLFRKDSINARINLEARMNTLRTKYIDKGLDITKISDDEFHELGYVLNQVRVYLGTYIPLSQLEYLTDEQLNALNDEDRELIIKLNESVKTAQQEDLVRFNNLKLAYNNLVDIWMIHLISKTNNPAIIDYVEALKNPDFDENTRQLMFGSLFTTNITYIANLVKIENRQMNKARRKIAKEIKDFQRQYDKYIKAGNTTDDLFNKYGQIEQQYLLDDYYKDMQAHIESGKKKKDFINKNGTTSTTEEITKRVNQQRKDLNPNAFYKWYHKNIVEFQDESGKTVRKANIGGEFYAPNSRYVNPRWISIQQDATKREFYNHFKDMMERLLENYHGSPQEEGFLPASSVRKDKHKVEKADEHFEVSNILDETIHSIPFNYVGLLNAEPTIDIPVQYSDEVFEAYQKRVLKVVNAKGYNFNSIKEIKAHNKQIIEQNKIRHGEAVSYKLDKSIPKFIESAINYDAKKEIESTMLLALATTENKKFIQVDGYGRTVKDFYKTKSLTPRNREISGESTNVYKHLKKHIEMVFYEKFTEDKPYNKTLEVIKTYSAFRGMGFNVFSGVKNISYGGMMSAFESISGRHFTMNDFRQAEAMYNPAISSYFSDVSNKDGSASTLANALIKEFNIISYYNDYMEYSGDSLIDKEYAFKMFTNAAFAMQQMGEHMMQNKLLFAMLNSHRLVNGRFISFSQYVETRLHKLTKEDRQLGKAEQDKIIADNKEIRKTAKEEWDKFTKVVDIFELEDGFAVVKKTFSEQLDENAIVDFQEKVKGVSHELHGIYNKEDKGTAENNMIWQVVLQFRHWVNPGWNKRFGTHRLEYWNERLEQMDSRDYRNIWKMLSMAYKDSKDMNDEAGREYNALQNILKGFQQYITNVKYYWHSLSEQEKQGASRAIMEMTTFFMLLLILKALKGAIPDEDKHNRWINFGLYQIDALRTEIGAFTPFYGWINEGSKIMQNPAATWSFAVDAYKFSKSVVEFPFIDADARRFKGGVRNKELKVEVYAQRLVPGLTIYRRLLDLDNQRTAYKLY